tara:strand:- start:140 stop:697 length:558 start_codon:yes stop_codon:yes gene_type:complete
MKRNIILLSLTIIFIISSFLLRTIVFSNKPEEVMDLEGIQKSANERYITAQILSQSLDNVYRLFEVNLASNKNDKLNEEASVDFINTLTDILYQLKVDVIEIKPLEKHKSGKYTYIPYRLKLACDFEKFGKLVSELERNERLITISEFEYNNSPENVRRSSALTELPNSIIEMEIATITLNKSKK